MLSRGLLIDFLGVYYVPQRRPAVEEMGPSSGTGYRFCSPGYGNWHVPVLQLVALRDSQILLNRGYFEKGL